METIITNEEHFYRSKQYGRMLLICLFVFLIYILFRFFIYNRIPADLTLVLILGVAINWTSWNKPIISFNDSKFIFRNGLYRKRIDIHNIKSVILKGNSYYWNMKIVLKYNEGGKDKEFIVWASMVEDYQSFYSCLSDKINKNDTVFTTISPDQSPVEQT